ncbi:MAG: TetR/AcrR family transcriptional regulator [Rhizobiaceae bacterium]|nr:TetR/AcrR family transcriptional regulator [Rhizobiaceae bacterium]MCV0408734.1 TetR/AcrR family transcriptional regulator [Rhizobiaceae bacterium]
MNDRKEESDDPKRRRVLDGAVKVFLTYGFQRTTMDDIAKAAEMSRPALYLIFRNKGDIYRAIAAEMLEQTISVAREGLMRKDGMVGERLVASVAENMIEFLRSFRASPHGSDILDMKNNLAADIISDWRERMARLVADAICEEAARKNVDLAARGLSARTLAEIFLDGLEGMKMRAAEEDDQRNEARQLGRLIDIALRP